MVVADRIVWGHIPRTGGDATHELFRVVKKYHRLHSMRIDDINFHSKHDPFWKRSGTEGKELVLNIRNLPSVFLSCRKSFMLHGIYPDYRPMREPCKEDFLDPHSMYGRKKFERLGLPGSLATIPDRYLRHFTKNGQLEVGHWLRMEHLREDFIELISLYYPMNEYLKEEIRCIPTKEPLKYNHQVSEYFSDDEVKVLYENNPLWRSVEDSVYQ